MSVDDVRVEVYRWFIDERRAPTVEELAGSLGVETPLEYAMHSRSSTTKAWSLSIQKLAKCGSRIHSRHEPNHFASVQATKSGTRSAFGTL
ncbi:MAG: hypothetical protein ABR579_02165 [Actinomycetota bacterium]